VDGSVRAVIFRSPWIRPLSEMCSLFPVTGQQVNFLSAFEGRSVVFHFLAHDVKTANKVAGVLVDNVGKTLLSIEKIELPLG
jgi:hypothetical protein